MNNVFVVVEVSKLLLRRYSWILSVGNVNLRLFVNNFLVLNNEYINRIEYFIVKFVLNGIVMCYLFFSF